MNTARSSRGVPKRLLSIVVVFMGRMKIMTKNMTDARREFAQHILARCDVPTNPIAGAPCEHCDDAKDRAAGRLPICDYCCYPKFICNNHCKNGMLATWRKFERFSEVIGSPKYALLHYAYERMADCGEITLEEWVTKAEALGIGENVAYWKAVMVDHKLDLIKAKLNELIMKVNTK